MPTGQITHVISAVCQGLLSCRRHIGKREDPGDEVGMTFADCRPQIEDCKLKDTKNLPDKGDTIKNITSCESEKVAWEQG